jgi:hypothetical protein
MRVSKVRFLTFILKYVTLEPSICGGNYMSGLTEKQRKLYNKLQKTINNEGNVADLLKGASKDDLLKILTDADIIEELRSYNRHAVNTAWPCYNAEES